MLELKITAPELAAAIHALAAAIAGQGQAAPVATEAKSAKKPAKEKAVETIPEEAPASSTESTPATQTVTAAAQASESSTQAAADSNAVLDPKSPRYAEVAKVINGAVASKGREFVAAALTKYGAKALKDVKAKDVDALVAELQAEEGLA